MITESVSTPVKPEESSVQDAGPTPIPATPSPTVNSPPDSSSRGSPGGP